MPGSIWKTVNLCGSLAFAFYPTLENNHWGLYGMSQTNTNKGEEVIIPDYDLFDIGRFCIHHYNKNKWSLSGGLRFDTRHVNGESNGY